MTGDTTADLTAFFDDAATFPPGSATLAAAITATVARRGTPVAATTGPSVLKADDLAAANAIAIGLGVRTADALPVSLVVASGGLHAALAAAASAPAWRLVGLELKVPSVADGGWAEQIRHAAGATVPVFVELQRDHLDAGALDLLAETHGRLKFRTGGLTAAAFPSPADLAHVIHRAVRAGVPFKLTAGLHQALPHTDAVTGFAHHGFLSIARATDAARAGADASEVGRILSDADADTLTSWFRSADGGWRDAFRSFGTCSVAEPRESLAHLGLLGEPAAPTLTGARR